MTTTNNNKKILVTGGTGFLGSHLIRTLLEQGFTNIRAIRRASSSMELVKDFANQVEWVETDLFDIFGLEDAFVGVQQVYHCAGLVSYAPKDKALLKKVNSDGTANIVNAALDEGVEKLIHVSSVAALGRPKDTTEVTEKTAWTTDGFNTQYAVSKQLGEMEVWRGMAEGLNAAIVNPCTIIGTGDWSKGALKFFDLAQKEFKWVSTGSNAFVDVCDVVEAMIRLMNNDIADARFIIASENMSYKAFFQLVADALGRKPGMKALSPLMGNMAWRYEKIKSFLSGEQPFVTKESVMVASLNYTYQNQASIEQLKLNYTPVKDTIQQVATAYQKDHKLMKFNRQ